MPLTDEQKNRALKALERRDRSVRELTDKLVEKGETPECAAEAAEWLISLHFLDDERYAGQIVRHYSAKGYGRARIKNELYRHGVPRELWDGALEKYPEPDGKLDTLLRARLRSESPDRAELKRATDALQRRGFSWGEISEAVERYKRGE